MTVVRGTIRSGSESWNPSSRFRETPGECTQPNWLVLRIQPREGIALQFEAKVPGPRVQLGTVKMDFCYADYFGQSPSTGYETLLYDCMVGSVRYADTWRPAISPAPY